MSDESADADATPSATDVPATDEFDPAAAFALLGDETRLRILRELWEAGREDSDETVPFETLRERTGVDDSGRFNYHLGKLTDRFVERTDDGYELRFAGARVVGALLEGTYAPGDDLDVPAGGECTDCGVGLRLRYEDERVRVECPDCGDAVSDFGCPPGVLAGRDQEALPEVVDTHLRTLLDRARRGICPSCSGPTTVRAEPREAARIPGADDADDGKAIVRLTCDRCGETITSSPTSLLVDHPSVVAFLHERGVDPEADPLWVLLADLSSESRVVSEEPYRVAATFHIGDEALTVAVDAKGEIVDVVES